MASEEHRAGTPPLVDSVVRVLVWSSIIASLTVPILAVLMIWQISFFAPWDLGREPRFEELQRRVVALRAWFGGIVSGGNPHSLTADARRMRNLSAYNGEATTVAATLHLVIVRFADRPGETARPSALPQRNGYRSVGIDITAAGRSAALIIADAPVLWNVTADAPAQRARLAFEGEAAFDIANGYPGLLAGFRIGSFGAGNTTRPLDMLDGRSGGVRRFCAALAQWTSHFGLKPFDTTATVVENPTAIRVTPGGVAHDGRDLGGRSPYYVCERKLR